MVLLTILVIGIRIYLSNLIQTHLLKLICVHYYLFQSSMDDLTYQYSSGNKVQQKTSTK